MNAEGARLLHAAVPVLLSVIVIACSSWTALALFYQLKGRVARALSIAVWAAFAVAVLIGLRALHPWLAAALFAAAFALVLLWWHSLRPSNDRPWADDVARMLWGETAGDTAVLHNVRNFDWRGRADYVQRWETRSYDLRALCGADLIVSYWDLPGVAHVLVSFGFDDGAHVAFSVEIRRERGQSFSAIAGFFKRFGLSVIAADERDVVRVRTNIRGEDDYLYRLRLPPRAIRSLFCAYVEQANRLVHAPRFYNTLTVNCTTLVYHMIRHIVGRLPFSLRLVFSGLLPGYVYAVGGLDERYPLAQLRQFGRITERARRADSSPSFSHDIRAGIPALPPP
jgi:Domain of unknown function (DUF4105)